MGFLTLFELSAGIWKIALAIKLDLKFQNNQLIEFENNQLIGNFQLIGQLSNFLNKAKKQDFMTKIPSENSERLSKWPRIYFQFKFLPSIWNYNGKI